MSGKRFTLAHTLSATLATALLAGSAWIALHQPAAIGLSTTVGRSIAKPPALPSPEPARSAETPSRSLQRSAPELSSPTPSRTTTVTASGSCGASFYDEPQGTASGEPFDPEALTAAHKTLPLHSVVRVTNPDNGKSVTVRINDRGPYIDGRCLDLSRAAFRAIADLGQGVLDTVRYEVLAK